MGQIIKEFSDGSFLEYDTGNFDDWCVYLTRPNGARKPPRDTDYMLQLKTFSYKYGVENIYNDFIRIYNSTQNELDLETLDMITDIADAYGEDALELNIIFSTIYAAMIAEQKKAYSRLGKRIKRLAVHKLLVENWSVYDSANFMRNMNWREISHLCEQRGF